MGQTVCLPPSPGGGPFPCYGGSTYVIRPGDTLFAIAQRFGVPLNALIAANPQLSDSNKLQAGQAICLPR